MNAATTCAEEIGGGSPLRIAIVSTPRSGNSWLRCLLGTMYRLEQRGAHHPDDLDWNALPERMLLQLHWRRAEPFLSLLARRRFRVVVLARHPLDVLISILHFAPHEPQTARWLEGEGGNESGIFHDSPLGQEFLGYATGPRAAALLGVSREWWPAPEICRLRYEDLVADPRGELQRLGDSMGVPAPAATIAEAIDANCMEALRANSQNQHFWRGRPGHWRTLLPAAQAERIYRVHRDVFEVLGYKCDPDRRLGDEEARANWDRCR